MEAHYSVTVVSQYSLARTDQHLRWWFQMTPTTRVNVRLGQLAAIMPPVTALTPTSL